MYIYQFKTKDYNKKIVYYQFYILFNSFAKSSKSYLKSSFGSIIL